MQLSTMGVLLEFRKDRSNFIILTHYHDAGIEDIFVLDPQGIERKTDITNWLVENKA